MSQSSPAGSPLSAALEIAAFLEDEGIPYVILGGLAVHYWGEPRATRDVDITVMVPREAVDSFFARVLEKCEPRIEGALEFAHRHRVLLVRHKDGTPIDISLAIPGYEEEVMRRARPVEWPGGGRLQLISPEDLIIHKCVAARPRDLEDVKAILIRQKGKLDLPYIRRWLEEFALALPERNPRELFDLIFTQANPEPDAPEPETRCLTHFDNKEEP